MGIHTLALRAHGSILVCQTVLDECAPKKKTQTEPKKTQNREIQKSDTSVIKIDLRRTFNTWNEMSEIIFNMTSLPQDIYVRSL